MICCYQVTKIFSTKYGSAIASSARGPCNFGPRPDLANFGLSGSESRHCVFYPNPHVSYAWAIKIIHEKKSRVSLCVQELCHPRDFLRILTAIPVCQNRTCHPVLFSWFSLLWGFGFLVLLGQQRVTPFYSLNKWAWHKYWMGIYPTQIFPCSNLTVAWHICDWWSRRAWGRCRMIALLSWRCHWCWRMRTGRRTCWQALNHDRNEVLSITLYLNTVFFTRCGFFYRWTNYMNIRLHRKAFRAMRLLAYPRGLSLSRIYPILWRTLWPLHASALLHWLLWLS